MRVCVGTSGWQYASWRERFYPRGLAQREWLTHYARHFVTVEVNSTFYNLPSEATVQRWHDAAPPDFDFVLKASRYLTHIRRLRQPEEPVQLLLERARPLGRGLSTILLQLPPSLTCDPESLQRTLAAFDGRVRVAVEFRDPSWFSDEVRRILRRHDAALCLTDRDGESPEPDWETASWLYVRLHEGDGRPHPCYRPAALHAWAERLHRLRGGRDVAYVFFNNDGRCCAPRDAARLAAACAELGLDTSRHPAPGAIHPG